METRFAFAGLCVLALLLIVEAEAATIGTAGFGITTEILVLGGVIAAGSDTAGDAGFGVGIGRDLGGGFAGILVFTVVGLDSGALLTSDDLAVFCVDSDRSPTD
jgi:hypothetical protein